MSSIPRLETQRLILRGLRQADAPRLHELANHPDIADTTLHIPHPYPDGAAEVFIADAHEAALIGLGYTFAMVLKPDALLIGCIGLRVHAAYQYAELGYWAGRPYWGQGYTTEAAHQLLHFAFDTLGLNRVYATCFTRNAASARVMQKIGMTYEGTMRQHYKRFNRFEDTAFYGIIRSEWEG